MLWYNGPLKKAVEEVKASNLPFLVFIQGDDKLSKKYETFLNEKTVFHKKCIAVKITQGSLAYKQFKAIYNVVPVPSVFMIGSNGIPLGVLCYETTLEALHNKVNDMLDKFNNVGNGKVLEKKEKIEKSSLIEESKPESKPESKSEPKVEKNGVEYDFYPEEDKQRRLEEIRSSPRFLLLDAIPSPSPITTTKPKSFKPLSARLQFRLPSNDMPSWEFPNEATLRDIKIYLAEKLKLKNNFKLLKTYPRVSFSPEDDDKTLAELNLIPSASLIVIPVQDEAVQAKIKNLITQPNIVMTLVLSIVQPLYNIFANVFGYVKNIFQRQPPRDDQKENSIKKMRSDTSIEKRIHKKTSMSNVHGFNFDDSDSDIDTNTDNGNSTQQK